MSKMVNQVPENNRKIQTLIAKSAINYANKKPLDVANRLPRMYECGFLCAKNNDFEKAFILFNRYINTIEWLQQIKEFRDNRTLLHKTYMLVDKVDAAKLELKKITKFLHDGSPAANDNATNIILDADKRLTLNQNTSNNKTQDITVNFPETPTDEPVNGELDGFMTCSQLHKLLPKDRYLIIDTRTTEDFNHSRIKTDNSVNIPASEIKNGILATKFEQYLLHARNRTDAMLFSKRDNRHLDALIILDWMTNHNTIEKSKPLLIMKDILTRWDLGKKTPNLYFLDGGYTEWLNAYPSCVTDPNVTPPNVMKNDAMDEILQEVQYPEWLTSDEISLEPKRDTDIRNIAPPIGNNTNSRNSETIMNNSINNSTKSKQSFIYVDEESVDLTYLSQEIQNIGLASKNISSSKSSMSKPPIDRRNKPTVVSNNPQIQALLNLLVQLNDVTDSQEKLEKQLTKMAHDIYSKCLNNEYDSEDLGTLKTQESVVQLTLQNTMGHKAQLKNEWEVMKKMDIPMSKADSIEKDNLELRLGSVEQRIAVINMERKKEQMKQLEEQQNMLTPPRHNNNLIYKEPLKSEGSSTNTGLKRSLSSPNLAQVKKSKTENQLEDRKTPQIDRSSKPLNIRRNVHETNNNNNLQIASRDPAKRMDPVYRHGHPGITGLKNLGNSCYMNSIIQCLSNTAYLAKYFIENSYQDELNKNSDNETQGQIAEEFGHVIKALWRGHYKSIAPRDLKNRIGQHRLQFDSCEQQDSHEFLTFFLDWMHNDLRKPDTKLRRDGPLTVAEKQLEKSMEGQRSIISQLFNGQLRSSIACSTCSTRSITYETFNSLSISLMESYRCTLDDCLKQFLNSQKISGWACPNCKVPRDATKKFDFVKLAPIMVIHLNRFAGTDMGLEKKNTQVVFPLNDLNLRPYLVIDPESTNTHHNNSRYYNYNLYAISNHYGSMGGGHYTALCKSSALNKWYRYDDHTVTEVAESYVKAQHTTAYLLFYSSLQCEPSTYI